MQNELANGYEFLFLGGENNTYFFVTKRQVVYEIKFKPSSYVFGNQPSFTEFAFEFVIDVVENPHPKLPPPDAAIPVTIAAIFNDFFSLREIVVLYICENIDGRATVRNRKFGHWFEQFQSGAISYVKVDCVFGTGDEIFLTSLIMRFDNPRMADIVASFQKLSANYGQTDK